MTDRLLCLGLALLVLVLNASEAYQSGSYGGLSPAAYDSEPSGGACPAGFRGLKPYAHDCRRYINCAGGHAAIQTCPAGTAFSAVAQRCDYEQSVQCGGVQPARSARLQEQAPTPRCAPGVSGLQPHPYDCTKFLNCDNGRTFIQDCGPGTAFSPSQLICDFKHKVNCGDGGAAAGASYPAEGQASAGASGGLSCPASTRGLQPHPHDPHKYLKCGIGVQPIVESCELGKVFDGHSLRCVSTDLSAQQGQVYSSARVIGLLCPDGVEGLFVHPFDQTRFLNCKAGKVAVQSCIPGHVFSLSKGYCQPKTQLVYSDYVAFIVSEISVEYSLILTRCPAGTDGIHLYPYDAAKYIRCAPGGELTIVSCERDFAYSFSQRACRPVSQVNRGDRVKFLWELNVQGSYSYSESQAFQSTLRSCPHSLQGSFAYPFHAGYYVLCQNGVLQVQACPQGTFYSLPKRSCVSGQQLASHEYLDYSYTTAHLSSHFMQDLTTVTCPISAQGYYLHPFDCTKYIICRDQQTLIESCEQGKVFSISQRSCVARHELQAAYDRVEYLTETQHEFSQGNQANEARHQTNQATTYSGEISCPPGATGLHPHPLDCSKFLNCGGGQTFIQNCGPGTAFNAALLVCTLRDQVDCGERRWSEGSSSMTSFGGSAAHSAQLRNLFCPNGFEGPFPYPFDQGRFLNCKAGNSAIQTCAPGHVFSLSMGSCLPKTQLILTDYLALTVSEISSEFTASLSSCPSGIEGLYVYPYDAGKYIHCTAQGQLTIGSCDQKFAYSIRHRTCQPMHIVNKGDRVKLFSELNVQSAGVYTYVDIRAVKSTLKSCPQSLQGSFAYPFHAGYYVICQNGELLVKACPWGTFYSLPKRSCLASQQLASHEYLDYSYTTGTQSILDPSMVTCSGSTQGFYLHPFDCTKYIICRDQQTFIESCEQGKVFSISQRSCVSRDELQTSYDRVEYLTETQHEFFQGNGVPEARHQTNQATTYSGEISCPPGAVGLKPHPLDCSKFLNCAGGQTFIQSCGPDTAFSTSLSVCTHRDQVDCGERRWIAGSSSASSHGASSEHSIGVPHGGSNSFTSSSHGGTTGQSSGSNSLSSSSYGGASVHSNTPFSGSNSVASTSYDGSSAHSSGSFSGPNSLSSSFYGRPLENSGGSFSGSNSLGVSSVHSSGSFGGISCPQSTRGLYPHPSDPRKYLRCGIGVQAIVEQCPSGDIFDGHRLVCVSNGISSDRGQIPSARLSDLICPEGVEGLFAHPFDQTRFLNCKAGKIAIQSCIPSYVFSLSKGYCQPKAQLINGDYVAFVMSINSELYTSLSRCPSGGTEGHHLYPYDASKYVRCAAGGVMSIVSCGENMAYSYSHHACRPVGQVNKGERVKFISELGVQGTYGYADTQAFQSTLRSCPQSLQGSFAYPFHAGYYVFCQNGVLQVQACPQGTFYSLPKRSCVSGQQLASHEYLDYSYTTTTLSNNFMQDLTTITCPSNVQGYYLHPFDCTKYLICRDQQTFIGSCEQGKVFSISQRLCVSRDQFQAAYDRVEYLGETQQEFYQGNQEQEIRQQHTQESILSVGLLCPTDASGYFTHPFDCRKFLYCTDGQTFVQDCPPGQALERASKQCIQAELVDCTDRSVSTELSTSYRVSCPSQVYGLYAHPFDARSYLYCEEGRTDVRQCMASELFSVSRGCCMPAEQVVEKDRVQLLGNSRLSELPSCPPSVTGHHPYPFDCTKYLRCESGVTRLESCPPHNHFSLSLRFCQQREQVQRSDRVQESSDLLIFYNWWQQLKRQLDTRASIVCPVGLTGNYQHPTRPNKIISCSSTAEQSSRAFIFECPQGQVFSLSHRLCVPESSQEQSSYGWIDLRHDYREPKAYDQLASGSTSDGIKTTHVQTGDRWSNMNMQRPAGIGYTGGATGWSGEGRSYTQQAPSRSILYVEGSLQPTHVFETTRTEQTLSPTTIASGYDTTDFQRSTRMVETTSDRTDSSTVPNSTPHTHHNHKNWQTRGHSRHYHHRHPNLPDPFEKEGHSIEYHRRHPNLPNPVEKDNHSPAFHRRHPNLPNPFEKQEHSPAFHRRHPNLPNPFKKEEGHSLEFHRRHPNLPNPFDKPRTEPNCREHSPLFHILYPNLPNPCQTPNENPLIPAETPQWLVPPENKPGLEEQPDAMPNPNPFEPNHQVPDTRQQELPEPAFVPNSPPKQEPRQEEQPEPAFVPNALDEQEPNTPFGFNPLEEEPRQEELPEPAFLPNPTLEENPRQDEVQPKKEVELFSPNEKPRQEEQPEPKFVPDYPEEQDSEEVPEEPALSTDDQPKTQFESFPPGQKPEQEEEASSGSDSDEDLPNSNAEQTTPMDENDNFVFRSGLGDRCEFNCGGNKCVKQSEVCDGVNNCGNRADERQCDHLGYQLRLTGGDKPHIGRVEVKVKGQWGYVCDDKFGLPDADVVCRELGFKQGAAEVRGNAYFAPPERNFNYAMDEVECRGNETQLKDCDFKGWNVHNCGVDEVVGVVCKVPTLKCPGNLWLCHSSQECIPPDFVCDNTVDCADKSDESDVVCKVRVEDRIAVDH
ncbi:hypothetical protein KR222_002788 [Zaprionus bogoriensis]|nr:hypothetical protein KR222_002788 [Zaprionus bogoriensis]